MLQRLTLLLVAAVAIVSAPRLAWAKCTSGNCSGTCVNNVCCTTGTCTSGTTTVCKASATDTCVNGVDCASTSVCGSGSSQQCCGTGQSCIAGACCTASLVCNGACCATGQSCVGGTCCSAANICGSTCMTSGQTCVNGVACASSSVCGSGASATCCGSGQVCNNGACCTPSTCSSLGASCGSGIPDGCGGSITCGTNGACTAGFTCNSSHQCTAGCTAGTCASMGLTCGTNIPDGCGGTIASCGNAGQCSVAGQVCTSQDKCCTPTSCAAQGKSCGTIFDGCGDALDCGTCSSGQTCVNNVCTSCVPTTCAAQNATCGQLADGCGGTLSCGSCTSPQTCGGGGTPYVCGSSTTTTLTSFSAGALIIPMDQCYNPDYSASADYVSNGSTCAGSAKFACYANYTSGNVRLPYGLIYLLAVNNIPVTVILKPTKLGIGDADFSVTPPSTITSVMSNPPQTASHLTFANGSYSVATGDMSCGTNTVYYGGMPFVVDAAYAQQALAVIAAFNTANSNLFTPVPMHIINYDFQAPVLGVMSSRPKPVGIDGSPLTTFFDESGINSVVPNNSAYTVINGTSPNFSYAWQSSILGTNPGCPNDNCTTLTWNYTYTNPISGLSTTTSMRNIDVMWVHSSVYQNFSDINTWYQDGGTALVIADATGWEATGPGGVGGSLQAAANGAQKGPYCATLAVSGSNLNSTPGPTGDYPASNKFLQIGDMDLFVHGVGGGDGSAYTFGGTPYAHTDALTNTANYTAIAGHPKVNGTQTPGNVVYLGSLNSWHGGSAGKDAGLHIMYNSLLVAGDGNGDGLNPPTPAWAAVELSRSPDVGGPNGVYYVGTFDWKVPALPSLAGNALYSAPVNVYPYTTGHLREYKPVGQGVQGIVNLQCNDKDPQSACNFDLADNIASWGSRTVFIGQSSGSTWAMTAKSSFTSDNTIKFVGNNIGNQLGGVDYAAMAYIQPKSSSPVAGAQTRPAVGYVGARDGMLHAFCVDANGCYGTPKGSELWALIPSTVKSQMDTAYTNNDWSTVNVGGIIHAADVQDTFSGTTKDWRTVLLVGTRDAGSVIALDISDPDPGKVNQDDHLKLLWEADGTNANTGITSQKMGATRGASIANNNAKGSVLAVVTSSVYNTSSTHNSGINTYLLRITDGKVLGFNQKLYSRAEALAGGSTAQLANDVPAAPTLLDLDGDGTDETVLVTDFEGKVRKFTIDPVNLTLSAPVDVFDTNYKCSSSTTTCQPIGASVAISKFGSANNLYAWLTTGGADWARSTTAHSYLMGFNVKTPTAYTDRDLGISLSLPVPSGQGGATYTMPLRGYSQPSVAGTDLYAETTTVSIGNMNQLVLPVMFPGPYGQVEKWGNLNGTFDTSATTFVTAGQNFAGGAGSVVEFDNAGSNGQLDFLGTSTTERMVLAAGSSSLSNAAYSIVTSSTSGRKFSVVTWFDLGN